jgi:hypothetical protein
VNNMGLWKYGGYNERMEAAKSRDEKNIVYGEYRQAVQERDKQREQKDIETKHKAKKKKETFRRNRQEYNPLGFLGHTSFSRPRSPISKWRF